MGNRRTIGSSMNDIDTSMIGNSMPSDCQLPMSIADGPMALRLSIQDCRLPMTS
jgi:hypothetical protein